MSSHENGFKNKFDPVSIMSVIFLLILFSLLLAIGFLVAFLWSINDNQYDDTYTPGIRILFEDPPQSSNQEIRNEDL